MLANPKRSGDCVRIPRQRVKTRKLLDAAGLGGRCDKSFIKPVCNYDIHRVGCGNGMIDAIYR